MKIGVFDSGVGGKSVVNAIQNELPDLEIIYRTDKVHLPYGNKSPQELLSFVVPIINQMIVEGCEVIVIACNTVTTTLIEKLRKQFDVPFIGVEPMIKPAANLTKTSTIAVCATPTTLSSIRYNWLKSEFATGISVLEPDCSDWVQLIENKSINRSHIENQINAVCDSGADIIVLACTHYHWIEIEIKSAANGRAIVIQPEHAIINQLKRVLRQLA